MQKRHNLLKTLSFSRSEIRGMLILFMLGVILFTVRYFLHSDNQALKLAYQLEEPVQEEESINQRIPDKNKVHAYKYTKATKKNTAAPIDVNSAGYKELTRMGIPDIAARRILAYRKKGGIFLMPEDLCKIYGIDSALFESIRQYIQIKPQIGKKESKYHERASSFITVDLNHADTSELIRLPGIGSKLSGRIINYRNALGGFHSPQQLNEVYGISDSLYRTLATYLIADTIVIEKINLNTVTLEALQKHPYMDRYQAKAILGYRKLVGPFTRAEELIENYLITDENYNKISPYLTVE